MEVINHSEITDIAVVVTRYFGGILLGTGGLVRAYSDAARLALQNAEVVTILPAKSFEIKCSYSDYDLLLKLLEEFGVKILSTDFLDNVSLKVAVKAELYEDFKLKCTDKFCARIPFLEAEDIFMGF
jgi:putative IMPACT (imprinted ancient) family translation regulator